MKMNFKGYQWGLFLGVMILVIACKKPEERTCWKGAGEYAEIEYAVDSIRAFHLNKNIKYRFFQDNERKILVKGGENLIQQVAIDNRDNVLYASNFNRCHFLRDPSDIVEVENTLPTLRTHLC